MTQQQRRSTLTSRGLGKRRALITLVAVLLTYIALFCSSQDDDDLIVSFSSFRKILKRNHSVSDSQASGFEAEESLFGTDKYGRWPHPKLLRNIAVNNTIIVTSTNCGYMEFTQNWILHLRKLKLTNFLIIAHDESALFNLSIFAPGHVTLRQGGEFENQTDRIENPSRSFAFKEPGFYQICKQRPYMIRSILEQGYRILYSDVDTILLKNPFPRFPDHFDVVVATDSSPKSKQNDSQKDLKSGLTSGFIYLQPKKEVLDLLHVWSELMMNDPSEIGHDQQHWQTAIVQQMNTLSVHMLDKNEFVPGFLYFKPKHLFLKQWIRNWKPNPTNLYMVHANWMTGFTSKRSSLRNKGLWLLQDQDALKCILEDP